MMWFLLLCVIHIEPVILQGNSDRLILKGGKTPCEGHIKIYHDSEWGFIGDTDWNRSTEEVVCKSAHCGTVEPDSATQYEPRPVESKIWLDNIKCNGGESQLWQCEHPGWNTAFYPQDITRMVKCSNKVNISLDGFECAGAVKYTTDGGKSSGYFCLETWENSAADFLCESLGCGKSKGDKMKGWANWEAFKKSTKMKTSCSDIEQLENLWQCVTEEDKTCDSPAFVICEGYKRWQLRGSTSNVCHGKLEKEENGSWNPVKHSAALQATPDVWCQQMFCGSTGTHAVVNNDIQVTCADNISVTLKNNKTKCYGEVHIKVNNNEGYPVCGSSWTDMDAEVVCRELNCGKMVFSKKSNRRVDGIMDDVACSGKESSVWHCKAKRDIKSSPFQCSSTVNVVCGDSLDVRLVDGPAKCAGRVEIQYEGKWQKVYSDGWTNINSERVCTQVKCGGFRESANDKFSQGSSEFLAKVVECKENSSHISECITAKALPSGVERKAVGIICKDHKVVFLKGNKSCSGLVGIEHGSKTYWLSGSKQTWNLESANTVCRQSHCGESTGNLITIRDKMEDVWNETYSCSPNTTSLFECEKNMTQPVSEGAVYANNVTPPEELCEEPHNRTANTTTPPGCEKNMPQQVNEGVAYAECTGNIKVTLTKGCWGYVNICDEKECGGVCADTWTDKMAETLCKNLKCGETILRGNRQPDSSKVIFKSVHIPKLATNLNQSNLVRKEEKEVIRCNQAYVVCSGSVKLNLNSRYKCSGNVEMMYEDQAVPVCKKALNNSVTKNLICKTLKCGDALEEVSYFGPKSASAPAISNIECPADPKKSLEACTMISDQSGCELGGLRCSSWSKTELKFDKACSGAVFIHSKGSRSYVKNENSTEAKKFCEDLNCGKFKSYKDSNITYSQEQLRFIECEDEPKVTLSENCGGEVKINDINVCSTYWKDTYSDLICKEQGCGKAIATFNSTKDKKNGHYYHVTCEDYHHKLGQCSNFKAQCTGKLVSVYCISRVKFNTSEKCGGWININYQNKWEKLCPPKNFASNLEKELCEKLSCGEPNRSLKPNSYMSGKEANSEMTLDCPGNDSRIEYCIKSSSCRERPAEIYCKGYVPPLPPPPPPPPPPLTAIILGVGIPLILVIVIAVYVRFYIVRRAKQPINFPPRMAPNKEIEFESGEYDDVTRDEIEDYSPGRFRSEARVIAERDMRSASPISYDDIDEKAEAQPLTFQGSPAGTLRDNFINEGAIRQNDVNYEVEDPPENYDDIDASPVVSQTKAEVHGSSKNTTEGIPAATPGSVPEDKGYLLPVQDGDSWKELNEKDSTT